MSAFLADEPQIFRAKTFGRSSSSYLPLRGPRRDSSTSLCSTSVTPRRSLRCPDRIRALLGFSVLPYSPSASWRGSVERLVSWSPLGSYSGSIPSSTSCRSPLLQFEDPDLDRQPLKLNFFRSYLTSGSSPGGEIGRLQPDSAYIAVDGFVEGSLFGLQVFVHLLSTCRIKLA